MANPFENRMPSLHGPASDICPVVPNDAIDLPEVAVSLYVETGGAISLVTVKGEARTINVSNNSILPVGVRRVLATGTDATGIHAFTVT